MSLNDYFIEQNVVAISDIDTRALVRHIRDKGAMNPIVSSDEMDVGKLRLSFLKCLQWQVWNSHQLFLPNNPIFMETPMPF